MDTTDEMIEYEIAVAGDELELNTFTQKEELDIFFEKCGEIYINKEVEPNISLKFICTQCKEHFMKIDSFTQHLLDEHLSRLEEFLETKPEDDDSESRNLNTEEYIVEEFIYDDGDEEEDAGRHGLEEFDRNSLDTIEEHREINQKLPCSSLTGEDLSNSEQEKCSLTGSEVVDAQSQLHTCPVCGKAFKRKWNLRTHKYSHSSSKPFACDRCPASYANKQNLIVHQRRHTGEKPFACDHCPRRFVSSTERHSHMRSHTGERPHVCSECGKAHTTSSQLLEHRRRVHLNERNHNCLLCGKAFRTRNHLRAHHESIHSELPRSHVCSICKSAFKTASALYAHSKIHYEKRYKCKICSKSFAQHPGLYAHMKTHSKGNSSQ